MRLIIVIAILVAAISPNCFEAARSEKALGVDEISQRMEQKYRDAKFIHVEAQVTESPTHHVVKYSYYSSQESLRAICFTGDELLSAFSLNNGRVQEFVPRHPKRLLLEYDADEERSVPPRVYGDELDCLTGNATVTLIGPKSRAWPLYGERIRAGQLRQQEKVDGANCYVVEWVQGDTRENGDIITNTWLYYVDASEFVIRRMDCTWTTERAGTVIDRLDRELRFVTELFTEPQPIDWNIWPLVRDIPQRKSVGPAPEN